MADRGVIVYSVVVPGNYGGIGPFATIDYEDFVGDTIRQLFKELKELQESKKPTTTTKQKKRPPKPKARTKR